MTPTELVAAFEAWSRDARTESEQALADDQIGKAARLLGRSQGLALAALEMRRNLDIDAVHFGPHGGWVTGDLLTAWPGSREERGA